MNSNQEAKVSMYLKVQQFLLENLTALTALFSIITTLKTTLDDFITDILDADALATADTTGYTEAKRAKRAQITMLALRVSGGGAAYFKLLGDSGSQNEIYFTKTEFDSSKDTEVFTKAMQVHRVAQPVGALLGPHGISTTDISNLLLFSQQYLALVQLPQRKKSAKAAQGKKVDDLMRETDDFLNETLDPQMRVLNGTVNQELFDEYDGNRGIDNNPSGGGSVVVEGDLSTPGQIVAITTPSGLTIAADTEIKLEMTGGPGRAYFASAAGNPVEPAEPFIDVADGAATTAVAGTGMGFVPPGRIILQIQNTGAGAAHYKFTFL